MPTKNKRHNIPKEVTQLTLPLTSAADELLAKLKDGKLTLDWRKHQQAQAEVRITIEDILDELLPEPYTPDLFFAKVDLVYQHVYENYYGEGRGTYSEMPLAV